MGGKFFLVKFFKFRLSRDGFIWQFELSLSLKNKKKCHELFFWENIEKSIKI